MQPAEPGGIGEARGQAADRIGRGVGGDHGAGAHHAFDLGEHLLLDVGPLRHALHHDVGRGEGGEARGGPQAAREFDRPGLVGPLRPAIPRGFLQDAGNACGKGLGVHIDDGDGQARPEVARGNPGTHDPRAHDGRRDRRHRFALG